MEGVGIHMSASGPVWRDNLTDNASVAAAQGSENGEPTPERMEKDDYDEESPDYGQPPDEVFDAKEESPSHSRTLKLELPTELQRICLPRLTCSPMWITQ